MADLALAERCARLAFEQGPDTCVAMTASEAVALFDRLHAAEEDCMELAAVANHFAPDNLVEVEVLVEPNITITIDHDGGDEDRRPIFFGPWCKRCGDAYDAPRRDCPNVARGRGGHMFALDVEPTGVHHG